MKLDHGFKLKSHWREPMLPTGIDAIAGLPRTEQALCALSLLEFGGWGLEHSFRSADMKRKSFAEAPCPVARSLDAIGEWWSLLIVRDALMGKRRFGEFQQSLGAARNILAVRLKKLVACGILEKIPAAYGARREYVLTDKGRELGMVLLALRLWGAKWLFEPSARERLTDRLTGEEVGLELRTKDGRRVRPADIALFPKLSQRVKAPTAKA
jgi:DNA-binding HxlR family transcriptional regulator